MIVKNLDFTMDQKDTLAFFFSCLSWKTLFTE